MQPDTVSQNPQYKTPDDQNSNLIILWLLWVFIVFFFTNFLRSMIFSISPVVPAIRRPVYISYAMVAAFITEVFGSSPIRPFYISVSFRFIRFRFVSRLAGCEVTSTTIN